MENLIYEYKLKLLYNNLFEEFVYAVEIHTDLDDALNVILHVHDCYHLDLIKKISVYCTNTYSLVMKYVPIYSSIDVLLYMLDNDFPMCLDAVTYSTYVNDADMLKLLLSRGCPANRWSLWWFIHNGDSSVSTYIRSGTRSSPVLLDNLPTYLDNQCVDYVVNRDKSIHVND